MPAFFYDVEVLDQSRWFHDLPELWLPGQGIACNASFGEARAFLSKGPRNQDRHGEERPTERCELPADVVDDIAELAAITARQRELAARVAARVAPLLPLDESYELDRLEEEMRSARSTHAASAALDDIQQRIDRIRDGTIMDRRARRAHDLRTELAAAMKAR